MQYYMIENERFNDGIVSFNKDETHHIYNVMRAKVNDQIVCVDYQLGKKFLVELGSNKEEGTILDEIDENNELSTNLVLAYSLVSADKFEFVLQKAAELGVSKFIPINNDYSVAKIDSKKLDKKMVRWNKIVKEACEQSRRNKLMEIEEPIKIDQLDTFKEDVNIVAYEKADYTKRLSDLDLASKSCLLVIGPEGGISNREIDLLIDKKFNLISLGKRILRTETAAISLVSIVSNYIE
ncbi:MAG: 16S rRNA (uracil(1498)-N(3))-methyltransferase [Erysipelotrichales bacterium]